MADNLQEAVQQEINNYMEQWLAEFQVKLDAIVLDSTAPLVHHVFETGGNGRGWLPNEPTTVKRKGRDAPNRDTGDLESMLSAPGFIQQDDYVNKLGPSTRQTTSGGKKVIPRKPEGDYKEANKTRPFDNIGETADDEAFVEGIIEKELKSEYQ